ncbi:CotO family spore coat protein [Anoxybacillus sp. J5B_2022]|uniref:CotO family spore coat protein n=1 Tax=Anoxybacillus sp. J5B_2022 TaxID=3003246 RepID=UPI00228698CD|nr:CotO family spore coat protein [Anoxybacillus sp. J5B_2022]MCZ0756156.1 CotO family spore coat protein [Anoxybacillus sp. J5B_2022]
MKQIVPNEPLLYIVQPKLEPKTSYMQQLFQAKKAANRANKLEAVMNTKQFQEMTLEEQVQFLVKLPQQLSPIKCKIVTKKGEYQGFISEYRNGHLRFQMEKGEKITIPFKQVVSVSLIGFAKGN